MVWPSPCWAAPPWGNREARVRSSRASVPTRPRHPATRLRRAESPPGHRRGHQRRDAASAHRAAQPQPHGRSMPDRRRVHTRRQGTAPGGNRARSDALLRSARLALAVTDVRRASRPGGPGPAGAGPLCGQRRQPRAGRGGIARFVEVSRLDRSTEENRKAYAKMLMEQSEALLQWGELEQADKLAALAVEQRVVYGPFEAKPDDLLRRITALRQQNNPAGPRQIDPPLCRSQCRRSVDGGTAAGHRPHAADPRGHGRRANPAGRNALPAARCPADSGKCLRTRRGPPGTGLPGCSARRWPATPRAWCRPAASRCSRTRGVQPLVYDPSHDPTRNVQVAAEQAETIPSPSNQPAASPSDGSAAVARLQPVPTG